MLALDGLRGIAVLLVMVHHFVEIGASALPIWRPLAVVASLGWVGVELFFVLSGFLITDILLSTRSKRDYFRNFYGRRALRIFPLHYAVLVFVLFVAPRLEPPSSSSDFLQQHQAWLWLYATNFLSAITDSHLATAWFSVNHFWSLAIEEQFYLAWPALVRLARPERLLGACAIIIAASMALRMVISFTSGGRDAYLLTFARLDGLMIGAALAISVRQGGRAVLAGRPVRELALAAAVTALAVFLLTRGFSHTNRLVQLLGYPATGLVAAGLIGEVITPGPSLVRRVLELRVLVFLGKYSYGLYVFHGLLRPLFGIVLRTHTTRLGTLADWMAFLSLSFAVSIALALTSYFLMERRFLSLKRYF